ncbi:cofactor-independent phosphoglycerate mutase [Desulfogranum mediterraneum]|uniref:cofactor-independent phosphoglycerate mutase n=1 Tax=Desulfogranum mediterraneum TaxID=160661 RepID=UPI000417CAFF|nr:cofactor-independent phosphoglycerate mutase [Desulfogranum mediterraneum]
MKYILLIGDGMGDVAVPQLADKTPLEAAATPAMDRLARGGELLLVRTVPPGYPPGSDVANLSLLGYEPEQCYSGRAPLEAASMGVELEPDELAFRCNLVNVRREDDQLVMVDYSAGHISTEESRQLISAVQASCGNELLRLHPGISYRHLLVYRGAIPEALVTVPPHDHMDQDVSAYYQRYQHDPALFQLMEQAARVLADHPVNLRREQEGKLPANAIWLWGEGYRPRMEGLPQRYGISGGMISAVDLLMGIGALGGLEVVEVEGATGYLDTNYQGKAEAALEILASRDFVAVHVEAPDEAGHQGLAAAKVQAIEDFDQKIVAPILAGLEERDEAFRLVVTMDHYTPIHRRTHEDWPVPMVLYDSRGVAAPSGVGYTEANVLAAVEESGLRLESGAAFFNRFMEQDGHHG